MTDHALASFEAKDGTGRWEATKGIIANGQRYHFTSSPISRAPARWGAPEHVRAEEDDGTVGGAAV
ncbi:MAG: hypothetical protein ACLUE1_07310 [Adlercreutzia equolifaciens]